LVVRPGAELPADEPQTFDPRAAATVVPQEVANALAGLRGQIRLLLAGPVGEDPNARKRLEVMLGETERIENAVARLGRGQTQHEAGDQESRAA
jgi:nitrogen-specific signal transduction histidine kinase